jgi:hypothetical protein
MKHLFGEPLVYFVLLGTVMLGRLSWEERGRVGVEPSREIRLTVDDRSQQILGSGRSGNAIRRRRSSGSRSRSGCAKRSFIAKVSRSDSIGATRN